MYIIAAMEFSNTFANKMAQDTAATQSITALSTVDGSLMVMLDMEGRRDSTAFGFTFLLTKKNKFKLNQSNMFYAILAISNIN